MKKLLSIVLALALCLTAFVGCLTVSAAGENTIVVDTANITTGAATTDVKVTITSAGVMALQFAIDYGTLAAPAVAYDEAAVTVTATEDKTGLIVEADANFTSTVITLTFDTAALTAGTYAIAVNDVEAGNYDEAIVAFETTAGAIVVADAVVEPPVYEDPDLKMRGAGVTLANGFALDFKVRKTMETSLGYSDIYITFEKPRYDEEGNLLTTEVVTVLAADRTNDASNAENYIYTLGGIQPQELNTTIKATIYGTKDGNVYTGATVEYSVLKFAQSQLKNLTTSSTPTKSQIACADMIYFAAAVQEYASYNIVNPIIDAANTLLGSTIWQNAATTEVTRELVNAQTNTPLAGATVRIRSAGVVLSSKVILYFNCADLGVTTLANKDNYLLRASYTDSTGELKTYDLEIDNNYQAHLDTLFSTELGTVVTASLINKSTNEVVSNTVTYSIETFISKNLGNAQNGAWCSALIKYGDSVRSFAGLD